MIVDLVDSDLRDRIDKKGKDIDHLNQKIIQAAEETKSIAEERIRASHTATHATRRPRSQARQDSVDGEEDLISGKGWKKNIILCSLEVLLCYRENYHGLSLDINFFRSQHCLQAVFLLLNISRRVWKF